MRKFLYAFVVLIPFSLLGAQRVYSQHSGDLPPPELGGSTTTNYEINNYVPLTDKALRNPSPKDWVMMRNNYQNWGFSPLKKINAGNVKSLQLVWSRMMEPGTNEGTPIVYNGIMFLANPADVIQAIEAATGTLIWQYRRKLPTRAELRSGWGQRKRSVFLYDDKVYFVSWDNAVVALDARTGRQLWEADRGGDRYATNTTGPIVVNGVVIAGSSCQEAPFTCYVTGHDATTGKELWRNGVIPREGEAGDETWGKAPFDKRWITGVWGPITYDPDLDLAFYGSSGIGPASEAQRNQIGASLAGTNTRFAVDPKSGRIRWKHQVLPQDNWDQECTFEMMPILTAVNPEKTESSILAVGRGTIKGQRKTLTGVPCKTGVMWSFDAASGEFLWAKSTVFQNLIKRIDSRGRVEVNQDVTMRDINKRYLHCPTHTGGRDWPFTSYNPDSNVMFVQLLNLCADTKARTDRAPTPSFAYNVEYKILLAEGKTNIGRIDAISVETGKTLWSWETPASNYSPVLATAGGILFNGGVDRYLRALDQSNGKVLWQTRLGSHVLGATTTYEVDGRQYIAVAAGGGFSLAPSPNKAADQLTGANMVYVFALPDR